MTNHVRSSSDDVSQPQPTDGTFVYAPLEHGKASIRLVRVLAKRTHEGYIRCEIRHATIDDSYICLSYVWGEPGDDHCIMVNGSIMRVRNNLFDFLERAGQNDRFLKESLWIDALCIDQANVGERNHQVQQMGRIYSYAQEVISWFGEDKDSIAKYFVKQMYPTENTVESDLAELRYKFTYADYWNRAWITQEVHLARKVTLLAKSVEIDYALLVCKDEEILKAILQQQSITTRWRAPPLIENRNFKYGSLIFALSQLGYRRCHDIRDRVYSLLALCDDGSDVQVDYNTSVERLARHTLECCERSFCLCSMRIVHDVLHLGQQLSYGPLEDGSSKPFAYMTLPYHQGVLLSRKCTPKPCRFSNCDGTEWSHTPGFVHQASHDDDPSITIYPSRICRSAFHKLTRIEMVAVGESRYRCDKVGFDIEKHYTRPTPKFLNDNEARTWWWGPPQRSRYHHLTLIPTGDICRIEFHFSSVIEMARDSATADPCAIVRLQRAKLNEPVLQLCSAPE